MTIANELWCWAFLPQQARSGMTAAQSKLASALEVYLSNVFHEIDYTRTCGIWCDGVIELSIMRLDRRAFLIAGAAYSPNALAPVEVEFHFARRRDSTPTRTIVRFGEPDFRGGIKWHRNADNAAAIVANRPRCDRDWAVAVELS